MNQEFEIIMLEYGLVYQTKEKERRELLSISFITYRSLQSYQLFIVIKKWNKTIKQPFDIIDH